jgi:hypothetical protein
MLHLPVPYRAARARFAAKILPLCDRAQHGKALVSVTNHDANTHNDKWPISDYVVNGYSRGCYGKTMQATQNH